MKQQEKTQRTRERILEAAILEFGAKSYEASSINTICAAHNISKGLIYHNFKNKDDLYLQCVALCYDALTTFLQARPMPPEKDVGENLRRHLEDRQTFFKENPACAALFFQTILQPPKHLAKEIREIRREFDGFYTNFYQKALGNIPLREGITLEDAMQHFSDFMEMFNGYFQRKVEEGGDYQALVADHEGRLSSTLDIMLYGIARQEEGGK